MLSVSGTTMISESDTTMISESDTTMNSESDTTMNSESDTTMISESDTTMNSGLQDVECGLKSALMKHNSHGLHSIFLMRFFRLKLFLD